MDLEAEGVGLGDLVADAVFVAFREMRGTFTMVTPPLVMRNCHRAAQTSNSSVTHACATRHEPLWQDVLQINQVTEGHKNKLGTTDKKGTDSRDKNG